MRTRWWPIKKDTDPCEIEKKIQTTQDLIAENNLRLDEMMATVDGEEDWMLVLRKSRKTKPPDSIQEAIAC